MASPQEISPGRNRLEPNVVGLGIGQPKPSGHGPRRVMW